MKTILSCVILATAAFCISCGSDEPPQQTVIRETRYVPVKPKKPTIARLNSVGDIAFFRRLPVYIPEPLVVEKCQRPAGPFG